jgi:glycosyltransferase involved in cell wall biosynthesis
MRVLVISHNSVGESNRKRIDAMAAIPGVQVALLTPQWWFEEGRRIDVTAPHAQGYTWRVGQTVLTNNGTRHVYASGLFSLMRRFQPDVIDLHEEPFSLVALQTLLARNALAPHSALVFCSYVNIHRRWNQPYQAVEDVILARADGAYAPNADVPPILKDKGLKAPAVVIPSGVDIERFADAPPIDLESSLNGAPRPYVGFLGRLEPVKGLDYLLEAATQLRSPGTLVIAGDGPESAHLKELAAERGLTEGVRFLPGMPFAAVPGFIRALDALVLPSITIPPEHKEQFGRVLTEAMAAGVPVLGSSSGAIPEVIDQAGLVVPERDTAALAEGIERLLADAGLRAQLAELGRTRVREQYGWPTVARRAVDLFEDAIARRRGPGNRSAVADSLRSEVPA